jgi:hypothetical protein
MKIGFVALAFMGTVAATIMTNLATGAVTKVVSGRQYRITLKAVGKSFTPETVQAIGASIKANGDSLDTVSVNQDGKTAVFTVTYRRGGNLQLSTLIPDESDPTKAIFVENVEAL